MNQTEQPKQGFFRKPKQEPMINEDVNAVSRRLRILEERYTNFRNRIQMTDQNMLLHQKKQTTDLKTINSEISDLKQEISNMNEKIDIIIRELKETAKKEDVEVLQKYINLWDPMNFVSRKEVEKIIKEIKEE